MNLGIAWRAFWAALFDREKAHKIDQALAGKLLLAGPETAAAKPDQAPKPAAPKPAAPARESALTLLAALQREARLVDLIREDLGNFSDAQVGAAARPCLLHCAGVLDRWFAVCPLLAAAEGDPVEVPPDASPIRYQWLGEGTATSGRLVHHGWQATKLELPQWTGEDADAMVIAPAQIQAP